jgi:hypothetical protein
VINLKLQSAVREFRDNADELHLICASRAFHLVKLRPLLQLHSAKAVALCRLCYEAFLAPVDVREGVRASVRRMCSLQRCLGVSESSLVGVITGWSHHWFCGDAGEHGAVDERVIEAAMKEASYNTINNSRNHGKACLERHVSEPLCARATAVKCSDLHFYKLDAPLPQG